MNPQSQQASGRRQMSSTTWPSGSTQLLVFTDKILKFLEYLKSYVDTSSVSFVVQFCSKLEDECIIRTDFGLLNNEVQAISAPRCACRVPSALNLQHSAVCKRNNLVCTSRLSENLRIVAQQQYLLWPERWRGWLRHWTTSRKVAGSIPHGFIRILHW
jgi:hypothetical protein